MVADLQYFPTSGGRPIRRRDGPAVAPTRLLGAAATAARGSYPVPPYSRAAKRSPIGDSIMQFHGIIPPVATPMKANEDLDLPSSPMVHRSSHRQRRARHLRPRHQQRVLRPGRAREAGGDRHRGGPRQQAGPRLRRHRGRVDPRGHPPDEDGRARRGRRRLDHHAVLRPAEPAGDLRPLPPHRREHPPAGPPLQQPGHVRRREDRRRHARPASRRSRTSSASRTAAATCRTRTSTSASCRSGSAS